MSKVQEDLQREKKEKKQALIKLAKKWGLYAGICLLVAIITAVVGSLTEGTVWWIIFIVALVGIYIVYRLFKKEYKQSKELF